MGRRPDISWYARIQFSSETWTDHWLCGTGHRKGRNSLVKSPFGALRLAAARDTCCESRWRRGMRVELRDCIYGKATRSTLSEGIIDTTVASHKTRSTPCVICRSTLLVPSFVLILLQTLSVSLVDCHAQVVEVLQGLKQCCQRR